MTHTPNVVPLHRDPSNAHEVCRAAPIEAKWVHQTDEDCLKATATLRDAAPSVHAQIAAGDHAIAEQLQRFVCVHREHLAMGLRDFHALMSGSVYWVMLLAAALLESPVNKHALSFLGMKNGETWLVAGFLAALNVMAASLCGKWLRQTAVRLCREWFVLATVALVAVGVMLALAGLRTDYIDFVAARDALPTSGATMSTLVALQALFFVVGAGLSFTMVPSDARLQRVLADKAKLRGRIDALLRQRTALAARHDRLWLQAEREVAQLRAHCMVLVGEYRDGNFASRRDGVVPTWMRQPLDAGVFAPIDLGPRVLSCMPPLAELIRQAELAAEHAATPSHATPTTADLAGA